MLHNTRHKPPRLSLKPQRLEKRKRVTLIAAFQCSGGAVLCADTMETNVEGFRMPVHKLEAKECKDYWLAIAGSGNSDLIDGFAYALKQHVSGWKPQLDPNVVGQNILDLLHEFHRNEVALYPTEDQDDKRNNFLVCVKPIGKIGFSMWELRGSTIKPVTDYSLMGIGSTLYSHELRRLYDANNVFRYGKVTRFGRRAALLLGIHLFALAKGTSTFIGGDTEAIFVHDDKEMEPVHPNDMRILEERVARFNEAIADIVLKCPDTTIHDAQLQIDLDTFTRTVTHLRKESVQRAAESTMAVALRDMDSSVNPELHIPENHAIKFDPTTRTVSIVPDSERVMFVEPKKAGRKKRG